MNNDIKKIIDYMKKIADKNEDHLESELTHKDCALLLEYITNLQTIEQQYSAILSENAELEKENKILRKNAEHNDKVVDKARWNENIYKSKIDEAIKYGNNCLENLKDQENYICESIDIVNLLEMIHKNYINILQGSGKE